MINAIIAGLRQTVGIRLVFAILTMISLIFIVSIESILQVVPLYLPLPNGYHTKLIQNALLSDTIASFIPILGALPFTASYIDDIKSKFARFFLIRSSYQTYLLSRIIVCFLSGGIAIVAGIFTAWGISIVIFRPMERVQVANWETKKTVIEMCKLMFLAGGFWSVVGMAMSTLMESKYISYAVPFVLYYLLVILYERYFSDLFIIYPKTWTDPTAWPYGCWGAAIFLLEMTLIFALFFAFRAGRRLQQL